MLITHINIKHCIKMPKTFYDEPSLRKKASPGSSSTSWARQNPCCIACIDQFGSMIRSLCIETVKLVTYPKFTYL